MNTKPVVLTILTGGGFTFEAACILGEISETVDFIYLKTWSGGTPGRDGIPLAKAVYDVPQFATVTKPLLAQSIKGFIASFLIALQVMRKHRVDLAFAPGCSHAVPFLLAARILKLKTAFLESVTRADRLSATGKLVYNLHLADDFIIQWPLLQARYPRSCLGTIL